MILLPVSIEGRLTTSNQFLKCTVRDRFHNAHDPKVYIRNADLSPFSSFRTKSVAPAFEDDTDGEYDDFHSPSVSSSYALPTGFFQWPSSDSASALFD